MSGLGLKGFKRLEVVCRGFKRLEWIERVWIVCEGLEQALRCMKGLNGLEEVKGV